MLVMTTPWLGLPLCEETHPHHGWVCCSLRGHQSPAHYDADAGHAWFPDGRSTADHGAASELAR